MDGFDWRQIDDYCFFWDDIDMDEIMKEIYEDSERG